MQRFLSRLWYPGNPVAWSLLPLTLLFCVVVWLRRHYYSITGGHALPVPVIVIGNISVGGTGKTPLVVWVVEWLVRRGFRPGVVSRGYGGVRGSGPMVVTGESDPAACGDEPVLIASRTGRPVVVYADRVEAGRVLIEWFDCDVLVSDDGLQHYRLERDLEVVVVDGARRFGNGFCLPAGPLREPLSRLESADIVLINGEPRPGEFRLSLGGEEAVNLRDPRRRASIDEFEGRRVVAVAGIGRPARFFQYLRARGLDVEERPFPDHHRFTSDDLVAAGEGTVLMTEKDAVKVRGFARQDDWYVPVTAHPDETLSRLLEETMDGNDDG
ncbi:MAG: tetraacyldisaccharide 4'-kinase [Gammaproteobacteria bacterium]|jgi:tetraacyldisaccharide 4'-kinase|nr:tetraacyldisaccharide 4'-kinase [Gammaproteobacteria bacterium]